MKEDGHNDDNKSDYNNNDDGYYSDNDNYDY